MDDAERDAKMAIVREHLHKANEEALAFRKKHPDSPLCAVAFQVSALAGRIEAEMNALPRTAIVDNHANEELR